MRQLGVTLAGLLAIAALAGCGGGGGGEQTQGATNATTTTRTTGGSTTPTTQSTTKTQTTTRPSRLAGTLTKGQRVVFKASRIQVGDAVKCVSGNASVVAKVPQLGTGTFEHAEGSGESAATISLATRKNGSVVADCL